MASSGINNCRDLIPYVPINFAKTVGDEKRKAHDITKWVLVPSGESSHPREDVAITTLASTCTPQEPQDQNSLLLISLAIEQTMNEPVTPQQLTTRKRRLVNAQVLGYTPVSFVILPSEIEANTYTVKLNKTGEQPNDPFGLNSKYNDILLGWTAETRQRPNGHCDTFYYHEKRNAECRSVADVRRFIFKGFQKLKVEVDPETNEVKEFRVEQHTKKRKAQSSSSGKEPAAKKQKGSISSELPVGNEVIATEKPGAIAYNNIMNSDNQNKEENVVSEFVVGEASETASSKRKLECSNRESSESAAKIQKSSAEEAIIESKSNENRNFLVIAYNNLTNRHNKKVHSKGPRSKNPSNRKRFYKPSSSNLPAYPIPVPSLFQIGKIGSSNKLDAVEVVPHKEVDNEKVTKYLSPSKLEKFDKASCSNVSIDALNMPTLFQQEKSESFATNLDCYEVFPQKKAEKENEGSKMVQGNAKGKEVSSFEEKREEGVVLGLAKNEELPSQFPYTEGNFGMSANFDPIEAAHDKNVDKEEEVSKAIHENAGEKNNYVIEEKGEEEMFVSPGKTDAVATAISLYEGNIGMSVNFDPVEAAHDKKVNKEEEGSKPIHENADQANNYVVEEKGEVEMIVNLARADEIAAEFSLYGGNDNQVKWGSHTSFELGGNSGSFGMHEVVPQKEMDKAKEGAKTVNEATDGNKSQIPGEDNASKQERKVEKGGAQTLVNIDKFGIFSNHEVSFLDDQHVDGFYDPNAYLLSQIEHTDFGIENHELLFNHGFKHL